MKTSITLLLLTLVLGSEKTCNRQKKAGTNCYKGRLEIKGICANYTIQLLQGNLDTSQVQKTWTDEHTGKSYTNVFRLGSPCTFPDSLKEGSEFYFIVDSSAVQNCNVCMAFYPTPQKGLAIKVLPGGSCEK